MIALIRWIMPSCLIASLPLLSFPAGAQPVPPAEEFRLCAPNGRSLAWAPGGQYLVSTSSGSAVQVWDAATGEQVGLWHAAEGVTTGIALSPDGRRAAASLDNGKVVVRDFESGEVIHEIAASRNALYDIAWSPDGTTLATGGQALGAVNDTNICLWDAATGAPGWKLKGSTGDVYNFAFSSDGSMLAAACGDSLVRVWSMATGALIAELAGHSGPVFGIAWHPSGRYLVSGGDLAVLIWDMTTHTLYRTLAGATDLVFTPAWSPDGTHIAAAGRDKSIRIWETGTWTLTRTINGHERRVLRLAWSPDGLSLASAGEDGTLRVWRGSALTEGLRIEGPLDIVNDVRWSPRGDRIAAATGRFDAGANTCVNCVVAVWDARTRALESRTTGFEAPPVSLAWAAAGDRIATASGVRNLQDECVGCAFQKLDPADGRIIQISPQPEVVTRVSWNTVNDRLAIGTGGTIQFWDGDRRVATVTTGGTRIRRLAWNRDGTVLASCSLDADLQCWDTDGRLLNTISLGAGVRPNFQTIAWSGDHSQLVTTLPGHLLTFDWRRGVARNLLAGGSNLSNLAIWSGDGALLAGEDVDRGPFTLNTAPSAQPQFWNASPTAFDFSPGAEHIAVGEGDGMVSVWRVQDTAGPTPVPPAVPPAEVAIMPVYTGSTSRLDVSLRLWNRASAPMTLGAIYVVLEAGGTYYFFPSFTPVAKPVVTDLDFPPGDSGWISLLALDSLEPELLSPLRWYAAMLAPDGTLIGELATSTVITAD